MISSQSLVLFDIDGTLLRGSGPHHRQALQAGILNRMKVHATVDGIDTAGTLDRDLIALMLQAAQVPLVTAEPALPDIVEACEAAYLAHCAADLRKYVCPGVVELLSALRAADVTIGVVTGNLQAIGWKKLELAGLRHHFHVGAFSQDGATRAAVAKRAAELATELRRNTGFDKITLIGDHRNDVIAAKINGYRSIAVATGVLSEDELWNEKPDLVVRDMTGLSVATVLGVSSLSEERFNRGNVVGG